MPDMLVKLYTLPDLAPLMEAQHAAGIEVRRGLVPEKHIVIDWVRTNFGASWASETEIAFANKPVSCYIAVQGEQLLGFACYEATCKDFFGPIGVHEAARGKRTGEALLLASLHAMAALGYGYAIIGGVGPAEFYTKAAGATLIPDSAPGVYRGLLHGTPREPQG